MSQPTQTNDLVNELIQAPGVIILLPQNPDFVNVASGLALYLALKEVDKQTDVICQTEMLVEASPLVGVQQVKSKMPGRNLIISFNYAKDAIDKVSYNVDNGKFNLIVVPKTGQPPLDPAAVEYSHSGVNGDLVILVGSQLAAEAEGWFPAAEGASRKLFFLVAEPDKSLTSETARIISRLGIVPNEDIANNLMQGLVKETHNFQKAAAADFEIAAALIRAGAAIPPLFGQTAAASGQTEEIKSEKIVKSIRSDWLKQPKIFSTRENN